MSYDFSTLVANTSESRVYNTVIMTAMNQKEPDIYLFNDENVARNMILSTTKNWTTTEKTNSYKIIDKFNIILYSRDIPCVLLTLEYSIDIVNIANLKNGFKPII